MPMNLVWVIASVKAVASRESLRSTLEGLLSWASKGRTRMKSRRSYLSRMALVVGLSVAALSSAQGEASAAPPQRIVTDISESYRDPELTRACGTTVIVTATGTSQVTLWRNEAGLVVREIDRFPGATLTYSAPDTGHSFSTRYSAVSTWDYGDGAELGSPVTLSFHGLFFHIPGTSAAAGSYVAVGKVDRFVDGIPITDASVGVKNTGNRLDGDFQMAICAALTG
jgi:hypothetical protein